MRLFTSVVLASLIASLSLSAQTWKRASRLPVEHATPSQLAKNGYTMYTAIERDGVGGLYVMQRSSLSGSFSGPKPLKGKLTALGDVGQPSVTADEMSMVFVRHGEGWDDNDLYIANRASKAAAFTDVRPLHELNVDDEADAYPWISADGLRIYYMQDEQVMVASRPNRKARFETPETVMTVSGNDVEPLRARSIWLTVDETVLYYVDNQNNIRRCERHDGMSDFETATKVIDGEMFDNVFVSGISFAPTMKEFYIYRSPREHGNEIVRYVTK